MVVIDNYDAAQSKKPPPTGNSSNPTAHPDQPPPYNAQHGTYHVSPPGEDRRPLLSPPSTNEAGYVFVARPERAWLRFGKALLVAVGIYVLVASLLGSWAWSVRWGGGGGGPHGHYDWPHDYPIPPGLGTQRCVEPREWAKPFSTSSQPNMSVESFEYPYSATTTFELPLSSQSLYLLSRGSNAAGSVDILTSAAQSKNSVSVMVTLKYYREDVKRVVKVCRVSRKDGEFGVGIFSPNHIGVPYPGYQVFFETLIVFPELDRHQAPLVVPSLETDVHNTLHRVHAVAEQVRFKKLRLQGSNGPISATSLSVDEGSIKTSNEAISGSFNGTRSLDISTSNGAIMVFVKMVNDYSMNFVSKLDIRTTNGPVEANVDLYAASQPTNQGPNDPRSTTPRYYVHTETSNSRLQTNFWHQPADSTLNYRGSTSNGIAKVQLHSAYQGDFDVKTTNANPELHLKEDDPSDPSGRGRRRKVDTHSVIHGRMVGSVEWVGKRGERGSDAEKGRAVLETSNAQAVLVL